MNHVLIDTPVPLFWTAQELNTLEEHGCYVGWGPNPHDAYEECCERIVADIQERHGENTTIRFHYTPRAWAAVRKYEPRI